ncbi:MAG: AAA family ATPase [Kiritimatiellia bacterium]
MIERITIDNFKSLRNVDVTLGRLNLFIGTNASGKSNFFDALRVLQGIGNGFTISEILDGKPKSATSEVWDGIRGGSAKACFGGGKHGGEVSLTVSGKFQTKNWSYKITFSPAEGKVTQESLNVGGEIYASDGVPKNLPGDPVIKVKYYRGTRGTQPHLSFESARPVLGQFARGNGKWKKDDAELAQEVATLLTNTQRVDPSPARLRNYSHAHQISRMGEHGENFAALVQTICKDPKAKDAYLSWLRQLRPAEVDDVGTLSGAVGEPLFMLKEGGQEWPAPVLSDGTLRFAAIIASFFQPDMPGIMTIEEIENGIHASRVRLLVELLRNQADAGRTQIMATTHSPIVLAWLKEPEYATTFFCKRDAATGESKICSLPQVPHFTDLVKKQPISDLFAEGWLEAAL